jgi:hypothetical protein
MTREMFERMDGLVSFEAMKQLQMATAVMTRALVADGFDPEDVTEYIQQNVKWTVSDVSDDMA